ncbi:MAG TPA: immunoglobulin-like domain-containing protein, partial [Candidatus Paceibacterota bacterium]|nr:immunoglobulin-like domain-containing protein [Candidatus Paceibacterota bacterium]
TVEVGSTYTDLGAVVADNVDNNLGYTVSLNGGAEITIDQLVIDTSVAGTHTIEFKATDQAGNTGTATRQVIVKDPTPTPTPEASSEPEPTPEPESASS